MIPDAYDFAILVAILRLHEATGERILSEVVNIVGDLDSTVILNRLAKLREAHLVSAHFHRFTVTPYGTTVVKKASKIYSLMANEALLSLRC